MGVYIPNMEHPKDGLYQIDHGKIHKYKAKGGTVRVYDIIEIVTCGECRWCEKRETANHIPFYYCVSEGISVKDTDYCSWGERRE